MPNRKQLNGIALVTMAVLLGSWGCGNNKSSTPIAGQTVPVGAPVGATATANGADPSQSTTSTTATTAASPRPKLCPSEAAPFAASRFPLKPRVNNSWLPLTPGMTHTLEGRADRGGGRLPHKTVFIVTDLVKVINGVSNVVVFDTDIQDGEIAEAELAFFAQDTAGNVWNLGEYPEEWEDGKFVRAPDVWFSGIGDARGGVHMKAHPQTGVPWYLQGWVPSIDFLDCGRVSITDESTCVPVRCFTDVVVTEETSPLDPDNGIQLKYSAPGVGIVQVGAVGGKEGETMQLIESRMLNPKELAAARTAALELEKRAYEANPIYKQTKPSS
jgi:hypothetical protein